MARTKIGVQPAPQEQQVPEGPSSWWVRPLVLLVIALFIAMVVLTIIAIVTDLSSGKSTPAVQPDQQTQIGPAPVENPPAQNVQENVVPAGPKVVDYHGAPWVPAKDGFNPFTIPVEKGLYDGTMNNMGWGSTERPEARAYALQVYPEFKDALAILAAIARDQTDKDVVFLSVWADFPSNLHRASEIRIALTVNGGKSWCNLPDLLPVSAGDAGDVRILASDDLIRLYGQDSRTGYFWWERVEKKSELPCF